MADVAKSGVLERLPERLMQLLQEKTKKKLMKERPQQPAVKTEFQTPTPPPPPKKKDCLTVSLSVHVVYATFRNLTQMVFRFRFRSL
jgi:hypothetical protein